MSDYNLKDCLTTLVTNGFNILKVDRLAPDNALVKTYKYDKMGGQVKYAILFTSDEHETAIIDVLVRNAKEDNSTPFIVAFNELFTCDLCQVYAIKKFFDFFGGVVNTGLILIPELPKLLTELGHNRLPEGLTGKPDDLHEMYIKECLQFIMESPARRYGKDRLFESLPDTVVLAKDRFMLLVDSKAYKDGFEFLADDIKRFGFYVEEFRGRYSMFFGDIFSFVVVTGTLLDLYSSLVRRSDELYKLCNCKLSCITSDSLGNITTLLKNKPEYRSSINWKNVFSETLVDIKLVEKEITRIDKDSLLL